MKNNFDSFRSKLNNMFLGNTIYPGSNKVQNVSLLQASEDIAIDRYMNIQSSFF